jgi:hypothetical protein
MKILTARAVVTVEEDDGSVHERTLIDWADGGPGRQLEMTYSHERTSRHGYTLGVAAPTSIVTDGLEHFRLNLIKNGPPRVIVGA